MKKFSVGFVCAFITLAIGFFIGRNTASTPIGNIMSSEVRLGGYTYTNPLLECEYNQSLGEQEYKPSRKKVEEIIDQKVTDGKITHAAVYYRDLNNGPWFGIHEKDDFSPASLLKLPVLIAYLDKADTDPSILQKRIKFEKRVEGVAQDFIPEKNIEPGHEYSIEELITSMMQYSDNQALFLLEKNIDNNYIDDITKRLGIETATENTPEDYMSVKGYATLLRVLYNASFLSRAGSEKALTIMSKSNFTRGIKAGLPANIEVAHKFGERELPDGVKQLHDCGIVYFPKHPYLLCIMTRGNNFEELSKTIEQISQEVYSDLQTRYKE